MSEFSAARHLALVPVSDCTDGAGGTVLFCGHCGARVGDEQERRICDSCGLGLALSASAGFAPEPGDAFIVLDRGLVVCAVSRGAEKLLQIEEMHAVDRHLSEFLEPADAEAPDRQSLVAAVLRAALGEPGTSLISVRPTGAFGVRHRIRIGRCSPGPAALLVFC